MMIVPQTTTIPEIRLSRQDIEHLPNFKRKTRGGEYSATCPNCGGEDRFLFWEKDGGYWCRVCNAKGFVVDGDALAFNREQYLKWQVQETERKRQEQEAKLTTLERLNRDNKSQYYHGLMLHRDFWYSKGLLDATIDWWELGYCPSCPTAPGRESYTIPVTYRNRLYNIRHRLVESDEKGKYRPEMAGLPACMFNADVLHNPGGYVCLVEGEIKVMVLEQWGISAIGIPGATTFKSKWLNLFPKNKIVFIALDPGVEEQAIAIGKMFKAAGIPARICNFKTVKPDDFLTIGENTKEDFMRVLHSGRHVA